MAGERQEVPIRLKQRHGVLDAPGCDRTIDRLANRLSDPSQSCVVLGSRKRRRDSTYLHHVEGEQRVTDPPSLPVILDST